MLLTELTRTLRYPKLRKRIPSEKAVAGDLPILTPTQFATKLRRSD